MNELVAGVSWLGVVAGAVLSFLVGWLWFSPKLFGTKWAEGVGVGLGSASAMPVGAMICQFAGLLLMSWFVGAAAVADALPAAILATIAFTLLAYSGGLFTKKTAYARNVEAGYWIAALAVMVVCHKFF